MDIILDYIKQFANSYNKKVYIVGGYIRDLYLKDKFSINDLDICLKDSKELMNFLKVRGVKFFSLNEKEKIYRGIYENKVIDIMEMKEDTIEENLKNRDFTINALAYEVCNEVYIDNINGIDDLNKRVLRVISEENIKKDPLRIIRAIRMCLKYDFYVEEESLKILKENSHSIMYSPKERIFLEIMKCFSEDNNKMFFDYFYKFELNEIFNLKNLNLANFIYKNLEEVPCENLNIAFEKLNTKISDFELIHYISATIIFINSKYDPMEIGFSKQASELINNIIEGKIYLDNMYHSKEEKAIDEEELYDFFKKFDINVPFVILFYKIYSLGEFYINNNYNKLNIEVNMEYVFKRYMDYISVLKSDIINGNKIVDNFKITGKEVGNILSLVRKKLFLKEVCTEEEVENFIRQIILK